MTLIGQFRVVFSVRRAPFNEQVPLQGVSMSRRWRSRRSDGSTTSWGRSTRTLRPIQGPDMKFPEVWMRVSQGAPSLSQ